MSHNQENLAQRLKFSEQKRHHLKVRLAPEPSEENTFGWSIVDLMTLLLIFFISLYAQNADVLFSSENAQKKFSEPSYLSSEQNGVQKTEPVKYRIPNDSKNILNEVKTDFFKKPETVKTDSTETLAEKDLPNESLDQLKKAAMAVLKEKENDPETFSIRWNQHRLVFVLGERVTFPKGQAKLLPDSEPLLEKISRVIASKKDFEVLVSGHTDDTPIDTYQFPSNWELSAARAITVARFLCRNGVDPLRLSIQGYAEFRPICPNSTPENKRRNRRVEITLVKQKTREAEESFSPYPPK